MKQVLVRFWVRWMIVLCLCTFFEVEARQQRDCQFYLVLLRFEPSQNFLVEWD